jgi:uncharacterized protein (DUF1684 family)
MGIRTRTPRWLVAAVIVVTAGCGGPESPGGNGPAAAPEPAGARPSATPPSPGDPYLAEVIKFRQDRETTLKGDGGWLTIGGLWFLTQPSTTFGSDALNDIVFPASAPARAGTFVMRNGVVSVTAAEGVSFRLDGKVVTSMELKPDVPGPADRLMLGNDLQFWVHKSGDRFSIRLRDRNNPLRQSFTGLQWFPVDDRYRVDAVYTPYEKPKMIEVANILGDSEPVPIPGIVTFSLNGTEYKLEPFAEPGDEQFWFVFRDLTSTKETYPAARFLYAPAPSASSDASAGQASGKMVLDFNKTVNPPCAYNPYTTCPLPTEQNRLRTRIEAGEMRYDESKK